MKSSSTKGLVTAVLLFGFSVSQAAPVACLDQVYAALARAQGAALSGNQVLAHQQLMAAQRCALGPSYKGVQSSLKRLQKQSTLRPAEVQGALGLLSNAEAVSKGKKASGWLALSSALALGAGMFWTGSHILALMLALLVVWLMWRGFVQGQRFHAQRGRGLWWGLILLLLPTLMQGLFALLGGLGSATHMQPLQFLGAVASSSALWPVGALLSILGLSLLAYELYHICVQFGIFGLAKRPTLTVLEHTAPWELE